MTDVAVILLSYNRPRMLNEALASLIRAGGIMSQVVVVDDGSDFDVVAQVRRALPDAGFVLASPMSVDERLVTPRLGRLINQALQLVTAPYVTYLCDDDLFHPGWLQAISDFFRRTPGQHWTRGDWFVFEDGQEPTSLRPCPLDPRQLTTGNFAHWTACYRDEGIRWNETTIACHDDAFLWDVHRFHNTHAVPHCGAIAGWRRLHAHNALSYVAGAGYAANAAELFAGGSLE